VKDHQMLLSKLFGQTNTTYTRQIKGYILQKAGIPKANIAVTEYKNKTRVEIENVMNIHGDRLKIVGELLAAFPLKVIGDAQGKKATYHIAQTTENICKRTNDLRAASAFGQYIRPLLSAKALAK
jgi:hypothetical protein